MILILLSGNGGGLELRVSVYPLFELLYSEFPYHMIDYDNCLHASCFFNGIGGKGTGEHGECLEEALKG